jgi:aromatic ring-opening dioxygenase catalytic subunit (LigB family)
VGAAVYLRYPACVRPRDRARISRRALLASVGAAAGLALGCGPSERGEPMAETHADPESGRMPTAFIPHGGGPWPVLELPIMPADETAALAAYMRSIAAAPKTTPRALLVVSAHWETPTLTVNTGAAPGMYYDYGGFPDAAYQLKWPAPGDPRLASEVRSLLRGAGFRCDEDPARGYDHGTFIPLMLAYPAADVPVVQLSLRRGLDPAEHLAIGQALAPLRERGVYILGSGNSFHNLRALFGASRRLVPASEAFDRWLAAAVAAPPAERARLLERWDQAPAARECHPREEHLLPLMVVAGAAGGDPGVVSWTGSMAGFRVSAHQFG